MPFARASVKTMTKGNTRKNSRKASAMPVNAQRTASGSVNGSRTGAETGGAADTRLPTASTAMTPPGPSLDQIDCEQQHERGDQHQRRDRRGARVIELLQFDDDQQRHDLRDTRHVAGDKDHRAVFADGPR